MIRSALILFFIFTSCNYNNQEPKPRPRLYPHIDYPTREYRSYITPDCPFTMDIPVYAKIEKKKSFFGQPIEYPCWFDISLNIFSATVHCSYYDVKDREAYDDLLNDAFNMVSKHNVKANYREDIPVKNGNGSEGMLFKIEGPVASPYQFYITDGKSHFLRGSLYFDQKVNFDSLRPVIEFLKTDIEHLMASVKWAE